MFSINQIIRVGPSSSKRLMIPQHADETLVTILLLFSVSCLSCLSGRVCYWAPWRRPSGPGTFCWPSLPPRLTTWTACTPTWAACWPSWAATRRASAPTVAWPAPHFTAKWGWPSPSSTLTSSSESRVLFFCSEGPTHFL
jgi:hypothetical protein